jgi:hypothetical protein
MAVYVYSKQLGCMVDKATGERMVDPNAPLATPRVWSDLRGYASPVDGSWVEGRRARRYDLEKNNCIDANELPSPTGGKLKNRRFAEKHGLTHLLEQ